MSLAPGIYAIHYAEFPLVLDLSNGYVADGTPVFIWQRHAYTDASTYNQLWVVEHSGLGTSYTVRNLRSGTYLDLSGGSRENGTQVFGFHRTGGSNQHWYIDRSSYSGLYKLQNQDACTFLDLLNGGGDNGNPVVGWTGSWTGDDRHQMWTFERVNYTGAEIRTMIKSNELMQKSLESYAEDRIYYIVNILPLIHGRDQAAVLDDGQQYLHRAEKFDSDDFAAAYKDTVAKWRADNLRADGFGLLCGITLGKSKIPGEPSHAYNFAITDKTGPDSSPPAVLFFAPQKGDIARDPEDDTVLAFFEVTV